ncbi:uncharacterized protein LOC116416631 [Nasonia vitripennis]|uniref:Uncharacterized protein n=1 Tax=Nasonia vitripennis TaxID=7425 RepID=A0A7M7T832_NASVI|nr:uncharacterized protein LOC116416631 [Nasonia vitripennis]
MSQLFQVFQRWIRHNGRYLLWIWPKTIVINHENWAYTVPRLPVEVTIYLVPFAYMPTFASLCHTQRTLRRHEGSAKNSLIKIMKALTYLYLSQMQLNAIDFWLEKLQLSAYNIFGI